MQLGIPKEIVNNETRVAVIAKDVGTLVKKTNAEIIVQSGAGINSSCSDDAYRDAGAKVGNLEEVFKSDLVVKIHPPNRDEIALFRAGQVLISELPRLPNDLVKELANKKVSAISLGNVPRSTVHQDKDVRSSMANIAGYKAVLIAANELNRMFPMMMTAAGTIIPAKIFIMGVGVAGLQAIATAKRLGAVVTGFDIRPRVKEEVESLGAKFVDILKELSINESDVQDEQGYAKKISPELQQRINELVAKKVKESDIVITTAQVPDGKPPRLLSKEMVHDMKEGSIIIDMAASDQGGNCELSRPGGTVIEKGIKILGPQNLPSTIPVHASQMYSKNVTNLIAYIVKDGKPQFNFEDELVRMMLVTHEGKIGEEILRVASAAT